MTLTRAIYVPFVFKKSKDKLSKVLITNKTAWGVQIYFEGSRYEVRAKSEIIVSAGVIKSPQVLMISGTGTRKTLQKFGTTVMADLPVGKNYHNHGATMFNFYSTEHRPTIVETLQDPKNILKYILKYPNWSVDCANRIFGVRFFPENLTSQTLHLPEHQIHFTETVCGTDPMYGLSQEVYDRLFGPYVNKPTISYLVLDLVPQSRNYISIRSSNPVRFSSNRPKLLRDSRGISMLWKESVRNLYLYVHFMSAAQLQRLPQIVERLLAGGLAVAIKRAGEGRIRRSWKRGCNAPGEKIRRDVGTNILVVQSLKPLLQGRLHNGSIPTPDKMWANSSNLWIGEIYTMVQGDFFPQTFPAQMDPTNVWKPDINTWPKYTANNWKEPYLGWNKTGVWKHYDITIFDIIREAIYPFPLVITPLFPLVLLSLARQKHTPDTKKYFRKEYDYIVVGSGGAGAVVASRLSEVKCVTVLLLEAGKAPPIMSDIPSVSGVLAGGPIDWKFKTVPQKHTGYGLKNNQVPLPRGKVIGGSTIINGMLYVRGNRKDYDDWEAQGATGWGWRDVYPYFLKAENNTDYDIVRNGFHSTHGPMSVGRFPTDSAFKNVFREVASYLGYPYVDVNGPSQIGFTDFQGNIRHGQRCSNAKAYLVPAEDRENLDIVAEAYVTKILIAERRAIGVQFDFEGRRFEVKARREVILSAGNLNTPKLLMLSGIGPRNILEHFGITVIADLPVGKNLHEHTATILNFVVRRDIPPYAMQLLNPVNQLKYIKSRSGSLANDQGVFGLAFLPYNYTKDPLAVPDIQVYFIEAVSSAALPRFQLKPRTFLQLYGPYLLSTTLWCIAQGLHPRSRGYVSLRSRNPYDPLIVEPNFLADPEDVKVLVKAMKYCLKIAKTPPMQKFLTRPFKTSIPGCEKYFSVEDRYLECYARHYFMSVNHDVGTARMGHRFDSRTVVDPELRVKTIEGLRVVDASIMPSVPSGNIWNPVAMIGEKAFGMIKETIYCSWEK